MPVIQLATDPRMEFYRSEIPLDELGSEEHQAYRKVMKWLFECQEPLEITYHEFRDRTRRNVPQDGPMLQYFIEYRCLVEPNTGCIFYGEVYLRKFLGVPGLTVEPSSSKIRFTNQSDLHEPMQPRKIETDAIFKLHAERLLDAVQALSNHFRS